MINKDKIRIRMTIKVVTLNVDCEGECYEHRLEKNLNFIKKHNPDIIALQEVKYGSYDKIIEILGVGYKYFLDKRVKYNRMYGELLLSKYDIIKSEYRRFDNSPNIRGITNYLVNIDGNSVNILTTHMENKEKYNKIHTEYLSLFTQNMNKVILMGDFNYYVDEANIGDLEDLGKNGDYTYISKIYNSRPDRVYTRGFNNDNNYDVYTTNSDHKLIVVEIK